MSVTVPVPRRLHSLSPSRAVAPPTVRVRRARDKTSGCRGRPRFPTPSLLSNFGCIVPPPLSPVPSVSPPIKIESSSPTVVEGQTLDLNCVVAGQTQATITWYKRGGSLPSRHQVLSRAWWWGEPLASQNGQHRGGPRLLLMPWTPQQTGPLADRRQPPQA
jgi:hypothetical protein